MKFKFDCGNRHKYFNCYCQLKKYGAGDCTMRAIAIATGIDYKIVWDSLLDSAKKTGYLPNSRKNCEMFLDAIGWKRQKPMRKRGGKKKYKLKDAPVDKNINYIFHQSNHWTAVVKGVHRDLSGCWREWCVNSYWIKVD